MEVNDAPKYCICIYICYILNALGQDMQCDFFTRKHTSLKCEILKSILKLLEVLINLTPPLIFVIFQPAQYVTS